MHKNLFIAFCVVLFSVGCKSNSSLYRKIDLPVFDTEAHRGGRGLMPENTIPAMINAVNLGVSTIEMDCHITRDNQVIVAHDDYINPLNTFAPGKKAIPAEDAKKNVLYQMTYAEVKKFDVGSKYYSAYPEQQKQEVSVPLLGDLIDSVQHYLKVTRKPQVFYNIETKSSPKGDNLLHPRPEIFINLLMDVINQKKIGQWVIIQSFDPRTLEVLHQKYPEIKTSFLASAGSLEENMNKLSFIPTIYSPHMKLVTSELIRECKARRMKVIPWTVNEKEEIERLRLMGVDGIISDYPNLFRSSNK